MVNSSTLEAGMPDVHNVAWKMRRIQQRSIKLTAELLESHQLHFGLPRIMHLIRKYPDASQTELAKQMLVTDAAMSHSVKRLAKLKYIETTIDPNDQRRKLMKLTPDGSATLEACEKGMSELYERMFIGFQQEDSLRLSRMLDKIGSNLDVISEQEETE